MVVAPPCFDHMGSPVKHESGCAARREQILESFRSAIETVDTEQRQAFAFFVDEDCNVRVQIPNDHAGQQDKHHLERRIRRAISTARGPSPNDGVYNGESADDELDTSGYSIRAKNKRIMKATHQRGRSRHRRNSSHCSMAPYPPPALIPDLPTPDSDDEEPLRPKKQMESFRISETDKVVAFIASRLKGMQQLADKKIAKAWIKGICPKKQANFPYSNGKNKEQTGRRPDVPGWWPDQQTCRFLEPDHIKRDERMNLCLHLLRLRPDPAQLQAWNHGKSEPHPTHVTHGWTAFLMELAGLEIFDELPKEDKKRTGKKQELMEQMYTVAAMEERYFDNAIDGNDLYSWEEEQEDRKISPIKRSRQSSITSSIDRGSSQCSTSGKCSRIKKAKKEGLPLEPLATPFHAFDLDVTPGTSPDRGDSRQPILNNTPMIFQEANDGYRSGTEGLVGNEEPSNRQAHSAFLFSQYGHADPVQQQADVFGSAAEQSSWCKFEATTDPWIGDNPSTANSPAEQFSMSDAYQSQQASPFFPARNEYDSSNCAYSHQMVQIPQNGPLPEAYFQPLPSATYPAANMVPGLFIPHRNDPALDRTHPGTMPASQYFAPAGADPGVGDFQPTTITHQQYRGSQGLAERHLSTMQYHGVSFVHATS